MSSDLIQATVFYSWESDLPGKNTRNLIEGCLNRAIQQLGREDDLDVDPSLDRDTKGVSGSPVIFDTILEKIDKCTAFVADVSIINSRDVNQEGSARPTPNPNVLIELGYAIKSCGWDRILPVCNEYYGKLDQLPFDIPERRVIPYTLSDNPTPDETKAVKEQLTAIFKGRLKDILRIKSEAILDIQIGDPESELVLGHAINCQLYRCKFSNYPNYEFPDYERYSSTDLGMRMRDVSLNSNYYREIGNYTVLRNLTKRFAFAVTNRSEKTLESPRLEVTIETPNIKLIAHDVDSFPDEPNKSSFPRGGIHTLMEKQNRRNAAVLKQSDERTTIRADLEDIQAQRTVWSTCCYLGTASTITLDCLLYADNLSQPFKQQITMSFSIAEQSKTLKEWIAAKFIATQDCAPVSSNTPISPPHDRSLISKESPQ